MTNKIKAMNTAYIQNKRQLSYKDIFPFIRQEIGLIIYKQNMEQKEEQRFSQQFQDNMNKSRLRNLENDPISMHCKRDNLNPSPFYHSKNPSSYQLNYSPEKEAYKNPQIGKQFQYHRKQEDRASMYNLPNILENTNYQQSFHPQPLEKIMRRKQKDSWFLKMGWALEPTSHYRKDFLQKDGANYNKFNFQRPNNNNLAVFNLKEGNKMISNYKTNFQAHIIKKEAEFTLTKNDHLYKQNINGQSSSSEYQRKYDSMMLKVKSKDNLFSVYKRQLVNRSEKRKY